MLYTTIQSSTCLPFSVTSSCHLLEWLKVLLYSISSMLLGSLTPFSISRVK